MSPFYFAFLHSLMKDSLAWQLVRFLEFIWLDLSATGLDNAKIFSDAWLCPIGANKAANEFFLENKTLSSVDISKVSEKQFLRNWMKTRFRRCFMKETQSIKNNTLVNAGSTIARLKCRKSGRDNIITNKGDFFKFCIFNLVYPKKFIKTWIFKTKSPMVPDNALFDEELCYKFEQ